MNTLQFLIPRAAADVLPIGNVKPRARAAGVERPSLEYSTKNAQGQLRITCSPAMARFLVEQLRIVAGEAGTHGKTDVVIACERGVAAALFAIEQDERDDGGLTKGIVASPY